MVAEHLAIVARAELGRGAWNAAAADFTSAWLWHTWEAIDAYLTWPGAADASIAVCDRAAGDRTAAIVPMVHFAGRAPAARLLSRLESTGGPAFADDLTVGQRAKVERAIADHLRRAARRLGAYRIDLALAPLAPAFVGDDSPRVNPLAMLGCRESSTQSWIVDLRGCDEDALWQRVDQRVRKAVNRARRAGMAVREATADDLPAYLALHAGNCARAGIETRPRAYFEAIFTTFRDEARALILAGLANDGEPLAFHVFAIDKGGALYWTVASNERALASGANDLIQWEAMRRFLALGLERYETGEAFPGPGAGKLGRISDFKKGFGAALHPYFRGTIVTRPVLGAVLDLLRAVRACRPDGDA